MSKSERQVSCNIVSAVQPHNQREGAEGSAILVRLLNGMCHAAARLTWSACEHTKVVGLSCSGSV